MKLLFLAVIAAFVFFVFSKKRKTELKSLNTQSAQERLFERFVNGEIDEDTFKKMKEVIN